MFLETANTMATRAGHHPFALSNPKEAQTLQDMNRLLSTLEEKRKPFNQKRTLHAPTTFDLLRGGDRRMLDPYM
jgi:hypothetical protein